MLVSKASGRYAKALLELAEEQNVLEQTLEDVLFIKETIDGSRDLLIALKSPVIKPEKKVAILEEIFGDEVGELVHKFITLIARKNRQSMIDEIANSFIEVYNDHVGIIEAKVSVANKLTDEQLDKVKSRLAEVTGKKIQIVEYVDEDLRGGMAIKIADTVIDGTVKHKLEQLEDVFLSSAME
ncbi:ATP synthase F1 subunit delta [Gracilimonas sp. Q87]|uniref:ATP synthase F1 subunit delta n=1 Tax=Gracilimonas sp. Q87 TaxID=3384766 RepID=UPI003983F65A